MEKNKMTEEKNCKRGTVRMGIGLVTFVSMIQIAFQQVTKRPAGSEYRFDPADTTFYDSSNRLRPPANEFILICGWRRITSTDTVFMVYDPQDPLYQTSYSYFEGGKTFSAFRTSFSGTHCVTPPTDPTKFKHIFFCGAFVEVTAQPPPFDFDHFLYHTNSEISTSCPCAGLCEWNDVFLSSAVNYQSPMETLTFRDATIRIEGVNSNFTKTAIEAYFSMGSSNFYDLHLFQHDFLNETFQDLDFTDIEIFDVDGALIEKPVYSANILKSDGVGLSEGETFAVLYSTNSTTEATINTMRTVFTGDTETSAFGITGALRFFESQGIIWTFNFEIEFSETKTSHSISVTRPLDTSSPGVFSTNVDGNSWDLDENTFAIDFDQELTFNFVLRFKALTHPDDLNHQENKLVMNLVGYVLGFYRFSVSKVIDGEFKDQNITFKIKPEGVKNFRVVHITLTSNPTDIAMTEPNFLYQYSGSLTQNLARVFACNAIDGMHYGVNSDLNGCELIDINSCKFGYAGQCLDCNNTFLIDKYTKECNSNLVCPSPFYLDQIDTDIMMLECSRCPHFFTICPEGIDDVCPPNEQCSEIQAAEYVKKDKGFLVTMSSSLTKLEDLVLNLTFAIPGQEGDTNDVTINSEGHRIQDPEINQFFISTTMNNDFLEDPIEVKAKGSSKDLMSGDYITSLGYVYKDSKVETLVTTDSIYEYLILLTLLGGFAMNLGQIFMIIVQKFQYMVTFSYIRQIFFLLCFCHMDHGLSSKAAAAGLMLTYNPISLFTGGTNPSYPYECSLPKYFIGDIYLPCSFMSTRASFWLVVLGIYLVIKIIVSSISFYKRKQRKGMTRALLKGEKARSNLTSVERINLWMHPKFIFYVIECAFTEWFLIGMYFLNAGLYDIFNMVFIFLTLFLVLCNTTVVIHCTLFIFCLIKRHTPCMNKVAKFTANFAFVFNLKKLSFATKIYPLSIKIFQLFPMTYFVFSGSDSLGDSPEYNRHHGVALIIQALGFFIVINHCKPFLKNNGYLSLISALTLLCAILFCFNYLKDVDRDYRNICNLIFSLIVVFIGFSWVWFSFKVMGELCRAWNVKRRSKSI